MLAVQVENEYGAYGDDTAYLEHLADSLRRHGVDVPLFTCDQPADLERGALAGVLATANFGSRPAAHLATLRTARPSAPLLCTEFWIGWFDRWGGNHVVRDAEQASQELDELLATGASVNFYMFHGGTNFGFMNGANDKHTYRPTVTSYDYDAPSTRPAIRPRSSPPSARSSPNTPRSPRKSRPHPPGSSAWRRWS
ncbi:hypothetical protein GCM10020254_03430 [Streptomyces goshikiensis]